MEWVVYCIVLLRVNQRKPKKAKSTKKKKTHKLAFYEKNNNT